MDFNDLDDPLDPLSPLYPYFWAGWVCPSCAEDGDDDALVDRRCPNCGADVERVP
jgi:rubredoxin